MLNYPKINTVILQEYYKLCKLLWYRESGCRMSLPESKIPNLVIRNMFKLVELTIILPVITFPFPQFKVAGRLFLTPVEKPFYVFTIQPL
jgi:hypothetical protein